MDGRPWTKPFGCPAGSAPSGGRIGRDRARCSSPVAEAVAVTGAIGQGPARTASRAPTVAPHSGAGKPGALQCRSGPTRYAWLLAFEDERDLRVDAEVLHLVILDGGLEFLDVDGGDPVQAPRRLG